MVDVVAGRSAGFEPVFFFIVVKVVKNLSQAFDGFKNQTLLICNHLSINNLRLFWKSVFAFADSLPTLDGIKCERGPKAGTTIGDAKKDANCIQR